VPNLLDAHAVIAAARTSGGNGHLVSDAVIYGIQQRLAREEGIFSEPAGAVALAGALRAFAAAEIDRDAVVVCPVTGSGFKDAASVRAMVGGERVPLVEVAEFEAALL
jgi:threonine synthase